MGDGRVRALLFAVAVAFLVSPALAASSRSDSERPCRAAHTKVRPAPQRAEQAQLMICPLWQVSRPRPSKRRRHAAALALGTPVAKRRATQSRAGLRVLAGMTYAVQFKGGLSKAERDAAIARLRDKYKLRIVKFNKGLDILRLAPRIAPSRAPKSLGAALTPKIIQDLRKEPFVDAAYVDFPVGPPQPPAKAKPAPGKSSRQPQAAP
jgi:hypothetical protein